MQMKKKIKNLIKKPNFIRWKAKRSLIKIYKYLLEVNKILEEYITTKIIGGDKNRRDELLKKQKESEEMENMINFFKKV